LNPKSNPLKLVFIIAFFSAALTISLLSCKHEPGGGCDREKAQSRHNDHESHNMGLNCMNCHHTNGPGEGCFIVAGTVYDSLNNRTKSNGTIKIFTGPNGTGTLKATIEVDSKGNFYSSETLNFMEGMYPAAIGTGGDVKYMTSPVYTGQCNSCHRVSTNGIWVK
jgi:hypothetical protein